MNDTNRILEQKALRNVRGLVDRLERSNHAHEWRVVAVLVALVTVVVVAMWFSARAEDARQAATLERVSCEMDVWLEKSGELERQLREANPSFTVRDMQAKVKRERPFILANAKAECDRRAK